MTNFILTTHADHNPLVVALREAGVEIRRIEWRQPLPDLTGCLAFYGNLFDEIKVWSGLIRLKGQLRQHKVPYVFWNRDAPWNTGMKFKNSLALRLIKPVDIYLAHALQGKELFGGEAHYFPNAAQPAYIEDTDMDALRDESSYRYDVTYFGSFGNRKDRNARLRKAFLDELASSLKARWPDVRFMAIDTSQQPLTLSEQLDLIRRSKINLNVGAMCDLPGNASWGLPERVFGIPAAGGLVISDKRQHLADSFPGNSIPAFDSCHSCVQIIEKLLLDWVSLRALAEQQHETIRACHTYQKRAQFLLQLLVRYRKNNQVKSA